MPIINSKGINLWQSSQSSKPAPNSTGEPTTPSDVGADTSTLLGTLLVPALGGQLEVPVSWS